MPLSPKQEVTGGTKEKKPFVDVPVTQTAVDPLIN